MVKKDYSKERKQVSRLIYRVLTENLSVREALLEFPKDVDDSSLKAAYHALVHFEADEDISRRDLLFKEEQVNYLELLANTLENGDALPINLIKSYQKYYKDAVVPHSESMKGLIKSLCKFLNV